MDKRRKSLREVGEDEANCIWLGLGWGVKQARVCNPKGNLKCYGPKVTLNDDKHLDNKDIQCLAWVRGKNSTFNVAMVAAKVGKLGFLSSLRSWRLSMSHMLITSRPENNAMPALSMWMFIRNGQATTFGILIGWLSLWEKKKTAHPMKRELWEQCQNDDGKWPHYSKTREGLRNKRNNHSFLPSMADLVRRVTFLSSSLELSFARSGTQNPTKRTSLRPLVIPELNSFR